MNRIHHHVPQPPLQQQQQQSQTKMVENDQMALAAELFDHFSSATTMRQILGLYRNMCDTIGLRPAPINEFYPKLKSKVKTWKAQALWKKFDTRAAHRVYNKCTACTGTRVLVIGAGPCGLRTAIEAQLLGAKVVVVEKRDRISRNNVLHLWPFLITDLRNLGAKKFYGKFCAGSIDHISIRQLQCILLKVALLLGVEVHEGISFVRTLEPQDGCGWRAELSPENHAVSHYEFDVLIGADGKRNTLDRFRRKEFRGKLAIAITANFINKKTEAEAKAEEISGVAFIFNQSFFKELYQTTGIDLENIVYYKDETHYFVMTAKKHSLIDKGVIIQDFADPAELLSPINVNTERLLDYAKEAAEFSTKYQMPNLEFAVNHYGKPDVAMFDFTSMFAAETSCTVIVRKNYRLLQCLVGDSLLEPFWPTGSGCARGFLSSMDAAYAIKLWNNQRNSMLAVLAQRESIYRLLAQTTPENLHRDIGAYTLDPATRYPNLNRSAVTVYQIKHLLDTDDPAILEQTFVDSNAMQSSAPEQSYRRKRRTADTLPLSTILLRWIQAQLHAHPFSHNLQNVNECFTGGQVLCALINRYRPDLVDLSTLKDCSVKECNELAFKIIEQELRIPRVMSAKDSMTLENIDSKIYLNYLEQICELFRGEIPHVKHPKLDMSELRTNENKAPDFSRLLKYSSKVKSPSRDLDAEPPAHSRGNTIDDRSRRSRKVLGENIAVASASDTPGRRARKRRSQEKSGNIDRERGILSAMARNGPDDQFSDRIKSMEQRIANKNQIITDKKPRDLLRAIGKIESNDWNIREIEKKIEQSRKTETGKNREKVPKWSKEQFLQRQNKMAHPAHPDNGAVDEKFKDIDQTIRSLDKQLKEGTILERGERGKNKVASLAGNFGKKEEEKALPIQKSNSKAGLVFSSQGVSEVCHFCKQRVYLMEKISTEGLILHRSCLKCYHCHTSLRLGGYAFDRDDPDGRFYCTQHYRLPAKLVRPAPKRASSSKLKAKIENASEHNNNNHNNMSGRNNASSAQPETKIRREGIANLDLLDRGQTPERIEFENIDAMSDGEPSLQHVIDENEWTDRNFGTGTEESESDLSSTDESDTESDSDMYEEAMGSPLGAQTLQLATDWIGKQRYSSNQYSDDDDDDDHDFYDSSEEDEVDSQTEGEELEKARKIRMQEVKLKPLPYLPTDTETEVQTDSESSSPAPEMNSATEISTDSEFEHDPVVKGTPQILIDQTHLRKPTRVQVKQSTIANGRQPTRSIHQQSINQLQRQQQQQQQQQQYQLQQLEQIHLEFKPLVQVDPTVLSATRTTALKNPRAGDYLLSKTASTEGIASKKSLELKKRYLLGESNHPGGLMKSDSTSVLDSKFKNFHSNISECQKRLNPTTASKIPTLQAAVSSATSPTTAIAAAAIKSNGLNSTPHKSAQEEEEAGKRFDDKENIYEKSVKVKNILNNVDAIKSVQISSIAEQTTPTTPPEKALKNVLPATPVIMETIDLITPEKKVQRIDSPTTIVAKDNVNVLLKRDLKDNDDCGCEIIDLTSDSPEKVVPIHSDNGQKQIDDTGKAITEATTIISQTERNKYTIDAMLKQSEYEKTKSIDDNNDGDDDADEHHQVQPPRSPVHETSIEVPRIPWNAKSTKPNDLESDSLSSNSSSSSTTSSVDDIPHYILDSTTSPDTLPGGDHRFVPRLEVRDTSGELMQIDSLMIIDGKYIGDPDDLKHMQMPDGSSVVSGTTTTVTPTEEVKQQSPRVTFDKSCDLPESRTKSSHTASSSLKYQSNRLPKRLDLKFDTKNENKIDTLKNMPLINNDGEDLMGRRPPKPSVLKLNTTGTGAGAGIDTPEDIEIDYDKTPTASTNNIGGPPGIGGCDQKSFDSIMSDSETEITGPVLTETELSDWNADDAVSENFVDIEFVLNSNKGTIKRNKRNKKSQKAQNLLNQTAVAAATVRNAKVMECPLAVKDLDFDGIEFMDTGSEDSCLETYSATNKALLKNRGYVKFVENTTETAILSYKSDAGYGSSQKELSDRCTTIKQDSNGGGGSGSIEMAAGIDFIEQGACILALNDADADADGNDLKTPMNEQQQQPPSMMMMMTTTAAPPGIFNVMQPNHQYIVEQQQQPESLNDIEEDSLLMIASQGTTTTATTTEESDALTIVTSPIESNTKTLETPSSEKNISCSPSKQLSDINDQQQQQCTNATPLSLPIVDNQNTSNSQQQVINDDTDADADDNDIVNPIGTWPKDGEECTYEEYVRKLQMKITKISNARDSIDIRKKTRRQSSSKSGGTGGGSGSEMGAGSGGEQLNSVIDNTTIKPLSIYVDKTVEEPSTLVERIEKISKERTKQKDLIHDLVMDKLQSKKQLNAEKRLNRSRNRSMTVLGSGGGGGSSSGCPSVTNPAPIVGGAATNVDRFNVPHCHPIPMDHSNSNSSGVSGGGGIPPSCRDELFKSPSKSFYTPIQKTHKDRPMSDDVERVAAAAAITMSEPPKIMKTQSFCVYTARNIPSKVDLLNRFDANGFCTPIPPPRRKGGVEHPDTGGGSGFHDDAERMRQDARARARLKSNQDLGLSPEEKMQLLRKRLHLDGLDIMTMTPPPPASQQPPMAANKSDDMKVRERKMMASKSVNDIRSGGNGQDGVGGGSGSGSGIVDGDLKRGLSLKKNQMADFTSDPNLTEQCRPTKRNGRGAKDPDRRRSIIKAVSDFFYKKKDKDSSPNSKLEKSSESVFGRFRISPKGTSSGGSGGGVSGGGGKSKDKIEILPQYARSKSENCLKDEQNSITNRLSDEMAPPIPPLPLNYQRSDDESYSPNENRDQRKMRAMTKATRQAELKRLRIAQEIQREQEEIEVKLKDLEARGVIIEKALRGEGPHTEELTANGLTTDDALLKELLEIWRNITQLKKRDDELGIRQQELKLEYRHAQLKEQLNSRLSCSKLDKDVAAEGAILNEMLEIVAKRATLRPSDTMQSRNASNDAIESDI